MLLTNLKVRANKIVKYYGNIGTAKYCPVCGKSWKKFGVFGAPERQGAQCPYCESLERHRLTWLYFQRMTNLFDQKDKRMLHVAPEPFFEKKLKKKLGDGYMSVDLNKTSAMLRMDVTKIAFLDESFDIIYCSHVLEHVLDDKLAMREFYRVLKRDGWAILLVPVLLDKTTTFEDTSVTDPAVRARLFGQSDHVRYYGRDYLNRLEEARFNVKVVRATDFLNAGEIERMGIYLTKAAGEIYLCTKKEDKNH